MGTKYFVDNNGDITIGGTGNVTPVLTLDATDGTGAAPSLDLRSDRAAAASSGDIRFFNNGANPIGAIQVARTTTDALGEMFLSTSNSVRMTINDVGEIGMLQAPVSGIALAVTGIVKGSSTFRAGNAGYTFTDSTGMGVRRDGAGITLATGVSQRQLTVDGNATYIGEPSSGSPVSGFLRASAGSGTDIAGGSLIVGAGQSTGAGLGGQFIFQTTNSDAAPTALNAHVNRLLIKADGGINWVGITTANEPAVSAGSSGTIFYDSTLQAFRLSANGAAYIDLAGSGILNVVEDTTPQLGGNLDVNGNQIVSVSSGNIPIVPNGTGKIGLGSATVNELVTINGIVSMLETSAPTLTTNYGKLYVSSTDSGLHFVDDGGVDVPLGGGTTASITDAIQQAMLSACC